jgi:hypothetical protein
MTFTLESPVFRNGALIPEKYARLGRNLSPPLSWTDAPIGTKGFTLIVEDPDAPSGTFRHCALFDMDRHTSHLPEGTAVEPAHSGVNDFGNPPYDGPRPPGGHGVHHYHFRLAALDTEMLDVSREARIGDVWKAAKPHILAEAELVGTFVTSEFGASPRLGEWRHRSRSHRWLEVGVPRAPIHRSSTENRSNRGGKIHESR